MKGIIYTETVVYAPPQAFLSEAPYQLVIVSLEDGTKITGRIDGERVRIGDPVILLEHRNGVPFFRREGSSAHAAQQDAPETKVAPQETI